MKTPIIHFIAALLLAAGAASANAQSEILKTRCSALITSLKANAILAKELSAQLEEAERAKDFEAVVNIMEGSAALSSAQILLGLQGALCKNDPDFRKYAGLNDSPDAAEELAAQPAAAKPVAENRASPNCHALIEAASNGQAEVVKKLLLKGANPYAENEYGISAHEAARMNGDFDTRIALSGAEGKSDEVCK